MVQNMTLAEAKTIIDSLSRGTDPETGEILIEESVFYQPEVIRALCIAGKAIDKLIQRELREKMLPSNAGASWTEKEDRALAAAFDHGISVTELAAIHDRTEGAIRSRLLRLGRN